MAIWVRFTVLAPMQDLVPFRSCAGFAVEVRFHCLCYLLSTDELVRSTNSRFTWAI